MLDKYKIVQVDADTQSKTDVAIKEGRAVNAEKLDILAGIYSSAHAVPIASGWTSRRSSCPGLQGVWPADRSTASRRPPA